MRKKSRKKTVTKRSDRPRGSGVSTPRVVFEPTVVADVPTRSNIQKFADRRRTNPTRSERELERILNRLNGGVLCGKFRREHPVSGRWIVDFFFPEIRLAIEVDGPTHATDDQIRRDRQKEADCAKFDITLIRITNREIWGNRGALIEKLRAGWRQALDRKNRIVGMDAKKYGPPVRSAASHLLKPRKGRSSPRTKSSLSAKEITPANLYLIDPRAPKPWTRRVDEPLGSRDDFKEDSGRNRPRR